MNNEQEQGHNEQYDADTESVGRISVDSIETETATSYQLED
jgi:hypothetical protein